jgi:formylglycine-generating enzyme required for sulfatase activity
MTLRALLQQHGLSTYIESFEREQIAVADLSALTEEDLRETLGMSGLMDRKRFRGLVDSLSTGGSATPLPQTAAGATRMDTPAAAGGATRLEPGPATRAAAVGVAPLKRRFPVRLGSYRVLGLVGAGGMGTVLRARHAEEGWATQQGGDVAIKLFHSEIASAPEFRARFLTEAGLGRRIQHPGLVPVYDVLSEGGYLGTVMGFVAGRPLSTFVKPGGMPVKQVLPLVRALGETLDHLHAQGVVHRDVKPANVMVCPDGRPVLLDLGIAKDTLGSERAQTQPLMAMGTSAWMAPEQVDAARVEGAADRYALGLMTYALLSGRMPWGEMESDAQVLVRKASGRLDALDAAGSVVSTAVMRMLSVVPGDRYASCGLFLSALQGHAVGEGAASVVVGWRYLGAGKESRPMALPLIVAEVLKAPEGRHLVWRPGLAGWVSWREEKAVLEAVSEEMSAVQKKPGRPAKAPALASAPATVPVAAREAPALVTDRRKAGERARVTGTGMGGSYSFEMAYVPAGPFMMGSAKTEDGRKPDEQQHEVRLTRGFEVGVFPVTQGLYKAVTGTNPSHHTSWFRDTGQWPVEEVSWFGAVRFCNALSRSMGLPEAYRVGASDKAPSVEWNMSSGGFRLLTEAEWEYAARAGGRYWFAGSDRSEEVGWMEKNSGNAAHIVGQKPPNGWGLYDMTGNVWEWVWDWYGAYDTGAVVDPMGPAEGTSRVVRGGGFSSTLANARVANRLHLDRGFRNCDLGLRLARTIL